MYKEIVSSGTPGQLFEAWQQVEKAIKANGITDVRGAMSDVLKNMALEKSVNEHFSGRHAVVSEKFTMTETVVSVQQNGRTYSVERDIKELLPTKNEGGVFDYYGDDIIKTFGDNVFTLDQAVAGRVQSFRQKMTYKDMLIESNKMGIYKEYDIVEALLMSTSLAKTGALNENGSLFMWLANKRSDPLYGDVSCGLKLYRSGDGTLTADMVDRIVLEDKCKGRVLFS